MCINCVKCCVFSLCIVLAVSSEATTHNSSGNCGQEGTWTVYLDFAAEAIGKAKNGSVTLHDTAGKCGQKETLMSYLEVASEMINKAKLNFPNWEGNALPKHRDSHLNGIMVDCSDLLRMDNSSSGVYTISPRQNLIENESFDVYCDMETDGGGWTVIQRRGDFENPVDYFFKDWNSYKEGFGDLNKEFWLGNDKIFALTNQGNYSARFDLVDNENRTNYAHYDVFRIEDECSQYTLHISNYSDYYPGGDAGDSMAYSNGMKFSTSDRDNDDNCAVWTKGAWWFKGCYKAHLNGLNEKRFEKGMNLGIIWADWKGYKESLERSEIKIRPKSVKH